MYSTIAAAALMALAPTALGGSLTINNHCSQNVYMFANQGFNETSDMMTLSPGGAPYNVPFQGESIVVKMHSDPDAGSANSELEYSVVGETLFYDLSNIVGFPELFSNNGMSIVPSDSSCTPINCEAGSATCAGAYLNPDDPDTLSCSASCNLVVDLCTANKGSSAPSSSSPAPAPSAPASTEEAPAPAPTTTTVQPKVNIAVPASSAPAPASSAPAPAPVPAAVPAAAPAAAAPAAGHPLVVNPDGSISALGLDSGKTATKNAKHVEASMAESDDNLVVVTTFTTLYTRAEATAAAAPHQRRHVHHHHHQADQE